jgi:transcriptional regulator with XRE-family HTH domain
MAKKQPTDATMARVRALFEKSGLTLAELGDKMGHKADIARQSAFQFMKTNDPRVSMLKRFAKAMGVDAKDLL